MKTEDAVPRLSTIAQQAEASLAASADGGPLSDEDALQASRLLAAACRWYYRAAEGRGADEFAQALEMTTSEACVAATALLHSQSLSPFEFGIWFVASEPRGG